jgi:hypothetical protein
VIAGLRERGWPTPREQNPNGEFLTTCLVWGADAYPQVWLAKLCDTFGYEAADDQESGSASFGDNADAARVIEAIDRLRWVIGLPPQGLFPLPYKLPDDLKRALEDVTGISVRHISAEPGSAEMRAPRLLVFPSPCDQTAPEHLLSERDGRLICSCHLPRKSLLLDTMIGEQAIGLGETFTAGCGPIVVDVPLVADAFATGIFNPVGGSEKRREADERAGYVPLPVKPQREERPYIPTKWIGGGE